MARGHIISAAKDLYEIRGEDRDEENLIARGRGLFRNINISPMVGDYVEYEKTDTEGQAIITRIEERKNLLLRPPVANVDQVLILTSLREPDLNLYSLDKMLAVIEKRGLASIIAISKIDKGDKGQEESFINTYNKAGYQVFPINSLKQEGTAALRSALLNKITAIAGPSGAGKSTFIRLLTGRDNIITASVSKKTKRGRQTTRDSRLYAFHRASYIFDTPGFSSLDMRDFDKGLDLKDYFKEIKLFSSECRFRNCSHRREPGCGVRAALNRGDIAESRYKSYLALYDEIEKNRAY